jgi:hypothetical protein
MTSKYRRTPLFGYDGNLGIPVLKSKTTHIQVEMWMYDQLQALYTSTSVSFNFNLKKNSNGLYRSI